MNSNLIIVRAGPNSLHSRWLCGTRNFDLMLATYGELSASDLAVGVEEVSIPGFKVWGWAALFRQRPDLLQRYTRIALIDDDIDMDGHALSRCFDIGQRYGLKIWQPSLSWDSYATYAGTLRNPAFVLRFVNYVEMMCPFFSASALQEALPLFSLGLESGIDLVWCSLGQERLRKYAIVDAVAARHTRPVGGEKAKNGFIDRNYESDIDRCLKMFDTCWPSLVSYEAITKAGHRLSSQAAIASASLRLLGSVTAAPSGNRRYRLKAVLDHLRHQLTRRPIYAEQARRRLEALTAPRVSVI